MTLPAYPSPISLSSIQGQFGGSNPISLSEYYATNSRITINISFLTNTYSGSYEGPAVISFEVNGTITTNTDLYLSNATWANIDPSSVGVYTITVYNRTTGVYALTDAALTTRRSLSVQTGAGTSKQHYFDVTIKDSTGSTVGSATNIGIIIDRVEEVGSVSSQAYMPVSLKTAGNFIPGDSLLLLSNDRQSSKPGVVISNRLTDDVKLITLISESNIRLTCSNNTPLTLENGEYINSTEALGCKLPVQDIRGFRWEYIVGVIDAGVGQVATIYCDDQCYAAGDENGRYIWTHNMAQIKQ